MNLSLCMIVKNEEKMLSGCLESVRNIVDEMIIVDTGSEDNTIAIAESFGAKIYHFDWTGDFSDARNESIKYARGNWILWLDADERINPDSLKELKKIIIHHPTSPEIYKINIKNFQKGGDYYYMSDAHRLFTNNMGIEFSGGIHEQISPSLQRLKGQEFCTTIEILHHGYNLNEDEQRRKNLRNREMLEKMVKTNPGYAYGHYTLAQNYAMSSEPEKAVEHFQIALNLKQLNRPLRSSLHVTLAETLMKLSDHEKAKKHIKKSLEIEPIQNGAYYLLYKIAEKENNFHETEKWLKQLYKINQDIKKSGKRNSTDVMINDVKILQTLANLYGKNQKKDEFFATCSEILELEADNFFANKGIANFYMDDKKFDNAFRYFVNIKDKFSIEDEKYLDVIGTIFLQNKDFEKSIFIYDIIVNNNLKNESAVKKLVGLLAKIGRVKEAQDLLLYFTRNSNST